MSSPPKNRSLIDSQFQMDGSASPTKNDIDFMSRKIRRLQQDYHDVCEQLQKVRIRLRKAQDFQIKYDLLSKQKSIIEAENASKDKLLFQYQNQIKQLEMICSDKKSLQMTFKVQKDNLTRQADQWRLKYFQAQQISSKIKAQQQYRMSQKLIDELQLLKKSFSSQQHDYKNKIRILQIKLSQKQTIESVLKQKNDKVTIDKDTQIQRLQNNLSKLRTQHLQYVEQKNNQISNVANKFQNLFLIQIQKLKQNQSNNSQKFSVQVQGLRGLIQLKNNEIEQLLKQMNDSRQSHLAEKTQLVKQIGLLKDKLYQRQRQNQLQLYNLKQRLIAIHHADTNNMKQNYEKLNLNLQQNTQQLQKIIRQKDRQIFQSYQKFEEKQKQLYKIIQQRDAIIADLNQKLRYTGDVNAKQLDNLHSSFHKITSQKGQLSTEYQKTLDFLNNQITKLNHSNQLKNQQIKDLHLQLAQNKKNFSQHIKDLQKKWRAERKQRQQERDKQRGLRQQLQDQFREKQQRWRQRQRTLEKDKEKQQRQKIKLKITVQQLQKNIERLMKHIKDNQQKLRVQMYKSQTTFVEAGSIRRQLTGQLQRQKMQLQSMKKMQLDQVHRQYEIQITRLSNQNQKLQNELVELKISFDKLDQEYKKIKNTTKNIDRISKEKMVQYERKMSALNAQINLTQNLYQSFVNAKSRVVKRQPQA